VPDKTLNFKLGRGVSHHPTPLPPRIYAHVSTYIYVPKSSIFMSTTTITVFWYVNQRAHESPKYGILISPYMDYGNQFQCGNTGVQWAVGQWQWSAPVDLPLVSTRVLIYNQPPYTDMTSLSADGRAVK
jgi:hypothetical protein